MHRVALVVLVLLGCDGTCDGPTGRQLHQVDKNWVKAGRLMDEAVRFKNELCACADATCAVPLERSRLAFEQQHHAVIASPNSNSSVVQHTLRAAEDCAVRLLGNGLRDPAQ